MKHVYTKSEFFYLFSERIYIMHNVHIVFIYALYIYYIYTIITYALYTLFIYMNIKSLSPLISNYFYYSILYIFV